MRDFWQKQTKEQPLFSDLLWSRPEQTAQSGKLLIVGGNAHGFAAPAEAFTEAEKTGIGVARVLLPNSLQKTVGRILEKGEYAPSTPSGSFSRRALDSLIETGAWSDATLLAGDFGRNSETAILLEQFVTKHSGLIVITKDGIDYFNSSALALLNRRQTIIVTSFAQLQKLSIMAKFNEAFKFEMDFIQLIDILHGFTSKFKAVIIVKHLENIFVAYDGQVSSTKLNEDIAVWRVQTAAHAAVWGLQNPTKLYEAITTSLI